MLPVEAAIAPSLKQLGFKKKARTWWRTSGDAVQVINLQKSPYGPGVYVNIGVYVRSLGDEEFPPESRCHISARLERVVPAALQVPVTSIEAASTPSEHFVEAVVEHGVKWLDSNSSTGGRRAFLSTPQSRRCFVNVALRAADMRDA
jgi:Domain of unknown function (DUF4304)